MPPHDDALWYDYEAETPVPRSARLPVWAKALLVGALITIAYLVVRA